MKKTKEEKRIRRKMSIRKSLSGSASKPRVFLYKSDRFTYVGVADDVAGKVLFSKRGKKNSEESKKVGAEIGKKLKDMKIERVVFDRSGYKYHGRVAAVADGIREAGIKV